MGCQNWICDLYTSISEPNTSTSVANWDALGETFQPVLGKFHGASPVPSLCVWGCSQPIVLHYIATDSTT
jgi:hypothetical protein